MMELFSCFKPSPIKGSIIYLMFKSCTVPTTSLLLMIRCRFLWIKKHYYICIIWQSTLPAYFTCDTSFHLDDIRGTGESEASQNSLPALQLVHLQDSPSFLQLSLGCSNICCDLKRKHANVKSLADTKLGKRFQGFYKKIKMIKSSVITASCDVHELTLNTSLTVTVMKWNVWVICQQVFFSFLICPQWFPLSTLTFTTQGQKRKHMYRDVTRKVY